MRPVCFGDPLPLAPLFSVGVLNRGVPHAVSWLCTAEGRLERAEPSTLVFPSKRSRRGGGRGSGSLYRRAGRVSLHVRLNICWNSGAGVTVPDRLHWSALSCSMNPHGVHPSSGRRRYRTTPRLGGACLSSGLSPVAAAFSQGPEHIEIVS